MKETVSGFDWDQGNLEHCRKHGVSRAETEGIFAAPVVVLPDPGHSRGEARLRAIGRTGQGRPVFVVFTIREYGGHRYIRPISARYMHGQEIERYEEDNPDI